MTKKSKKIVTLLLKILLSAGLISYLLYKTEIQNIVNDVNKINPFYLVIIASIMLVGILIKVYRWKILLHAA